MNTDFTQADAERLATVADLTAEVVRLQEERDRLADALREVTDLAIWMSGSPSFAPDGEAAEGWKKMRPALDRALSLLPEREDG